MASLVTYKYIKQNPDIMEYIQRADKTLEAMGYTEHSFPHVERVAATSSMILEHLGYDERTIELARIASIMHDIGKLKELSAFPANDYTDEGQLIGHIVTGTIMVDEKMKQIAGFPETLANELKHCILSHHGELEYGSPKKPALIEAVALAFADNTDAKLEGFIEVLDGSQDKSGNWLGFQRMFDSNLRATSR